MFFVGSPAMDTLLNFNCCCVGYNKDTKPTQKQVSCFFLLDREAVGRGDVLWEIIRFRVPAACCFKSSTGIARTKQQNSRITRNYYLPPPLQQECPSQTTKKNKWWYLPPTCWPNVFPNKKLGKTGGKKWWCWSKLQAFHRLLKPFQLRCWGRRSGAHIGWGARSAWTPKKRPGRRVRKKWLGEGVFFGGDWRGKLIGRIGLHGGFFLNGGNPHFTPQNDHV